MNEQEFTKPLFEELSEQEIKSLLTYSKAIKFENGKYLFKQGDISNSIYIIFSGSFEISAFNTNGDQVSFPMTGNGTVLGEIAFFDGRPRTASIKCLDTCECIILEREDFSRLENDLPNLAIKILKEFSRIIAERLRWADEMIVDLLG